MPAAPCTSGSTMTAATSPPCSRSSRAMSCASPGSACQVANSSGPKQAWKRSMPADGDRADRVAVVGVAQRDEAAALGPAAVAPVLKGHLQRDLRRGRAVVGVEDAAQAGRRDLDEPLRELDRRRVREAEHRRVRDLLELRAHGTVDRRMGVPVDVAPQRRGAVDVCLAVGVVERAPLGPLDDQRLLLGPALLLGERVPEDAFVQCCELLRGHGRQARRAVGRRRLPCGASAARGRTD